jgi:hypothetical protein
MTKMQFVTAAQKVEEDEDDKRVLEFSIGGEEFVADVPSTTQIVLLATGSEQGTARALLSAVLEFMEGILQGDGYKRFRKLMVKGVITHDLLIGGDGDNEKGIIDWIIEQVSAGRPPKRSSDSSPSPETAGKRSTGRAPGKGSIQSGSK